MRKPACTLLVLLAGALALSACGGSSSSSSSSASGSSSSSTTAASSTSSTPTATGSSSATVAADPSGQLKFTPSTLAVKAGQLTIHFTNSSPVGHNLTVANPSGAVLGATPTFTGGSHTLTVKLAPGTYTFFCSVPGHRAAGMQGTLTVS
jgi:plastocyanin